MKTWYCGFIGFLIKNAHLPSYNTMSLMFNAFIASSLCPYNKHNGTANFFDKSFKVKLYSKLLSQGQYQGVILQISILQRISHCP